MHPEEMRAILKKQPFTPLRLHTNNGMYFDVLHPDMAIVGGEHMAVGVMREGRSEPLIHLLTLMNINVVEPISQAEAPAN